MTKALFSLTLYDLDIGGVTNLQGDEGAPATVAPAEIGLFGIMPFMIGYAIPEGAAIPGGCVDAIDIFVAGPTAQDVFVAGPVAQDTYCEQ